MQWCDDVEEPQSEVMAALDSAPGVEVVYVAALSPPASQASQLVENTLEAPGVACTEEGMDKGVNKTLHSFNYLENGHVSSKPSPTNSLVIINYQIFPTVATIQASNIL